MTTDHEEAVRLAMKCGLALTSYRTDGVTDAMTRVHGNVEQIAALIAEVRNAVVTECVRIATEREALFDECGKKSEATGCHVVKCCIRKLEQEK